jgi:penicillin G amidase
MRGIFFPMRSRPASAIVPSIALLASLTAGARALGPVPPLGPLLDPVHGAWAAAVHADLPRKAAAAIPGLQGPVDVRYDARGVPHIFAASESDAYRALGYVVARDRLFQLDLQTRAASGRLTEFGGASVLALDQQTRQLGMPRAAERRLAATDTTSPWWLMVQAFADGINAFIDSLTPAQWPVEYRLLGQRPERWKPVNSLHLLNRMGWTLSYLPDEFARLAARARVGRAAESVFPIDSPIQEPIQPNGQHGPRFDFAPIIPPGSPDTAALSVASLLSDLQPPGDPQDADGRHFASNNWAVAPSRSRTGHALLANDPHLDLTLPSIWYEAHLVVPGTLDVYGVTIPGASGIVIGFNRDVAWGFTNVGADVVDFYRETVDDVEHPRQYEVDGAWRPLEFRIEVYRGPRGETLHTDTVRYTHRGPMSRRRGEWLSMRWTVIEPSEETRAFYEASHATTAREFLDAMARSYFAPAQNMLVADRRGTIAIRSTGHYPLRPRRGDGIAVRDGASSANDWTGFWPVDKYPQAFDPPQGYLASANQQPVDPRQQYAYLGDERAFDPWRALRINALLRANASVSVEDMRRFQVDPGSARADLFTPYFLQAVWTLRSRGARSPSLDSAARILSGWDRRYTRVDESAVLFEAAMRKLRDFTWDELMDNGRRVATPSDEVMLELLSQPTNAWWDDQRTPDVVEDRDATLARSLAFAYDSLVTRYGARSRGGWRWDRVAKVDLKHVLRLPGFSLLGLQTAGGRGTLSPSAGSGGEGASWRMVVELGPEVHGWATYPGGQSGNPASPQYADRVPQWLAGELAPVSFPRSAEALGAAETKAVLTLSPPRR